MGGYSSGVHRPACFAEYRTVFERVVAQLIIINFFNFFFAELL
jgi:hypothetical protein